MEERTLLLWGFSSYSPSAPAHLTTHESPICQGSELIQGKGGAVPSLMSPLSVISQREAVGSHICLIVIHQNPTATELLDSCLTWLGGPELLIQHSVWRNYLGLLIICLSPTLFSPDGHPIWGAGAHPHMLNPCPHLSKGGYLCPTHLTGALRT